MSTIKINWINSEKQVANITISGASVSGMRGVGKTGLVKTDESFDSKVGDVIEAPIKYDSVRLITSISEDGTEFTWLSW